MFTFIAWTLTTLAAIPLAIYLYLTWNFNYWRKRGITTAQPLPIFGSMPNIVTRNRNFIFDMQDIYEKYKSDNRAVGIFITREPEILLLHPKLIHDALVTNFTQYHDTITSANVDDRKEDKLVSRNPFWCAGEEWKLRRSEALPGLTQNKLKQSFAIWESSSKKLRKFLERKLSTNSSEIIETRNLSYRFTADVMFDFIWGIDAGTLTTEEMNPIIEVSQKWTAYVAEMLQSILSRMMVPWSRKIFPRRFFPKETDDFFTKLQKDAIDMRKTQQNTDRPDFLNHLLQTGARKEFNLDDYAGHSLTVLLNGFETAGTILMHALYDLASNPAAQEKLRSEIQNALKEEESTDIIPYEKLIALPYLDQCVHESLRLTSVIPALFRLCTKPTVVEFTEGKNFEVPVGMVAVIPVYALHMDSQYYPEPTIYKPERFDNAAHVEFTKQGIFLPFGDGPRICMGMRVGLLNVKTAIVEILRNYEVSKCALSPTAQSKNTKSFLLTFDGDVMLRYTKLKC